MRRRRTGLALLALAILVALPVEAREYNKRTHIPPAQRAKVNSAIARTWMIRATTGQGEGLTTPGADVINTRCGSLEVGSLPANGRLPREQIIVAGDIININQNCRSRR